MIDRKFVATNQGSVTIPNQTLILDKFQEECKESYDSSHLSNGHDLTYIMRWMLKRKYKSDTDENTIEACLLAAYSVDILKGTQLYKSIYDWSKTNKVSIFKINTTEIAPHT